MKRQNNIGRIVSICMGCFLLSVLILGCGSGNEEQEAGGSDQETSQESQEETEGSATESYQMNINGVSFGIDMDSEPVVEALGEPEEYFEGESCVSLGVARYYRYPGFNFSTYEEDGKHLIDYISVTEKDITTAEGIGFGSTKNDVLKAYGSDTGNMQGVMKYKKGDMTLSIWVDGERVTGIEFQKNRPQTDEDQQTQAPVCCP